ncbi:MAG: sugar nucleotide-binding protein [Azoarcus sp.]|nr:sugar nucleotide-binding protein [Azoarcus sp.]
MALKVKEIASILSSDWPSPAVRSLNSRLNTTRLRTVFGLHLSAWQFGVTRLLDQILDPAFS